MWHSQRQGLLCVSLRHDSIISIGRPSHRQSSANISGILSSNALTRQRPIGWISVIKPDRLKSFVTWHSLPSKKWILWRVRWWNSKVVYPHDAIFNKNRVVIRHMAAAAANVVKSIVIIYLCLIFKVACRRRITIRVWENDHTLWQWLNFNCKAATLGAHYVAHASNLTKAHSSEWTSQPYEVFTGF